MTNQAPRKQELPKKKNWFRGASVDPLNISLGKRKATKLNAKVAVPALKEGDRVKILTSRFGARYAEGKEKYTYGSIVSCKGGKVAERLLESCLEKRM